ncbi:MAG: hypothetical protein KJO07_11490 [Deltaproteobacteria bacterium]|nr:hypothetical protein [Deltaproteobacteria bacterium]
MAIRVLAGAALGVALVACGGDDGSAGSTDAGSGDAGGSDAAECTAFARTGCFEGDAYWYDSCDARGELATECSTERPCYQPRGECCRPPTDEGFIDANPVSTIVSWTFGSGGDQLAVDLTALATPSTAVRQKFGFRLSIDGIGTNLFLMSDLHETGGIGISFDFDTTPGSGALDLGPMVTQVELSGGTLVKLNRPYAWTGKSLRLRVVRDADGWVRAYFDVDGSSNYIGGRQFGNSTLPTAPALMHVFDGPLYYETTPLLDVGFEVPTLDGKVPIAGSLDYSEPEYANLDVGFNVATSPAGRIRFGGMTARCNDEGALDLAP